MTNNKQSSNHIPDVGKKVSSVEWLINFFETGVTSREEWLEAKEKAKSMQENEYFEVFKAGQESMEEGGKGFEQYYNEKFKGGK